MTDQWGFSWDQPTATIPDRRGYLHVCSSWNIPDACTQHQRRYAVAYCGGHRRPDQQEHGPGNWREKLAIP